MVAPCFAYFAKRGIPGKPPAEDLKVPFTGYALLQFLVFKPFTRRNTRSCVTRIVFAAKAWAAISMSILPIGLPNFSRAARISAYCPAASEVRAQTSTRNRNSPTRVFRRIAPAIGALRIAFQPR